MKNRQRLLTLALAGAVVAGTSLGAAAPAKADAASTAAIAVGAAAIVGALLYDSNNQPYYVRNGRHVYVSHNEANYWRQHHNAAPRRAYVPQGHDNHGHDRGPDHH